MNEPDFKPGEKKLLDAIFKQAVAIVKANKLSKSREERLLGLKWKIVLDDNGEWAPATDGMGRITMTQKLIDAFFSDNDESSSLLFLLVACMVHEILHCLNPKKDEDAVQAEMGKMFKRATNRYINNLVMQDYLAAHGM